uniref:Ig-like domain-containing protein n=1 Tax=Amphiprion percula TaxID=161767 RepID=A0A3P8SCH4_AMPPE
MSFNSLCICIRLSLTYKILCVSGVSESVLITQWPRYISSLPGSPAEIQCYQNDTDHSYTYWYRKPRGKGLELMVVVVANLPQFQDGFKSGFKTAAAGKLLNLTISSIEEKDEAVYFCATSLHGAVANLRTVTKT